MEYVEKILVLGDADTTLGFRIAGVTNTIETNLEKCEKDFLALISKPDIGILIVQEDFFFSFSRKTQKLTETLSKPVVVTIPSKTSVLGGKKSGSIAELVKRAIGIELKN